MVEFIGSVMHDKTQKEHSYDTVTPNTACKTLKKYFLNMFLDVDTDSLPTPPPASMCMPRKMRRNRKDMSIHLSKRRNIIEKWPPATCIQNTGYCGQNHFTAGSNFASGAHLLHCWGPSGKPDSSAAWHATSPKLQGYSGQF
jgi:hypothetical protein